MSEYTLSMGGPFTRAVTPDKRSMLIPHWIANPETVKLKLEAQGMRGAPFGIADEKSTKPFPCRVFMAAATYDAATVMMEQEGGIYFYKGNRGNIRLYPAEDPKAAEIQAEIMPGKLEAVANDPRVLGLRPLKDPRYFEVTAILDEGLRNKPAPAAILA